MRLEEMPVLCLDCQATGPDATRDQLLEIAWARMSPGSPRTRLESFLIEPPLGFELPQRIQRLTGLTDDCLSRGTPLVRVQEILRSAVREMRPDGSPCPTVIHFSRFERNHLRGLTEGRAQPPLLELVCTHEISKRLLPGLPRRGLRAVAGYFGHSTSELRRSADHVLATVAIWRALVPLLRKMPGIVDWADLRCWLSESPAPRSCGREYPMAPAARLQLSDAPGVYRMCRADGEVLYVGKAKSIRKRVNSYFQKRSGHPGHILEMLAQARRIEPTVTGSAVEAALLEADLIKALTPPYNIALRRSRELAFLSSDLGCLSSNPGPAFPFGPVCDSPGLRLFLYCLKLSLSGEGPEGPLVLSMPRASTPDPWTFEDFRAGWEEFVSRHFGQAGSLRSRRIMAMGVRLWEKRKGESEDPERGDDDGLLPGQWPPERVARFLEGVFLGVTHSIRKGRWLCRLSESTISWTLERGGPGDSRVLLLVESGVARALASRSGWPQVLVPPGYKKSMVERQASLSRFTYDRMVVLTRELRRLLSEGRGLQLRLGPGPRGILDGERLSKILRWI